MCVEIQNKRNNEHYIFYNTQFIFNIIRNGLGSLRYNAGNSNNKLLMDDCFTPVPVQVEPSVPVVMNIFLAIVIGKPVPSNIKKT